MENNTSKKTINKYVITLKLLVSKINRGERVVRRDFTTQHHVTHNFIRGCIDLGYIEPKGKKFKSNLSDVQPIHARKLAEKLNEFNVACKSKKNEATTLLSNQNQLSLAFDDYVSKLSDQQLLDELKKRGYSGKIERKIVETMDF